MTRASVTNASTPGLVSATRVWRLARTEFVKIWASRVPLAFLLTIPALLYLFVFEFYHVERAPDHLRVRHAADMLPVLYFATTKTLLFQAALTAFCAYWTTVDSQYGMIRVACAQPVTRFEYLCGKWAGIAAHAALFSLALVGSLLGWTLAYSGAQGMDGGTWGAIVRFACEVEIFTLALAVIAMGVSSFRRTVGAGLVTALLGMIALALMAMLPFDLLPPRLVFVRYFFYPLGEFPNPWPNEDSPFVRLYTVADFLTVALVTPLLIAVPALVYFVRRDVTE